ncbi:MAG: 16S rRNA (adenine(1518)-N(6)/adenine(1519)-N(6))-dimethyltransferase RsmA [Candidatus Omnitrophota bacterium]|nr:16S rRNA (adenine(1518)-N(6)/adenine(1519)-N(6))-dimethyltransferase RsmA [Candidatus Omnitrophota bacterium]
MLTKRQLKNVFSENGFTPLKRFGENYLIDGNIKDMVMSHARIAEGQAILEIGAGLGALTLDLAESGAAVFAVEKDRKAFLILKDLAGDDFPNLKIFNEDILKFDLRKIASRGKVKVIGNLPYYITTPVIEYLIQNRNLITTILMMVQREVANRLLACPGTKDYSSISCFVQYYIRPEYIHTVKRTSFYPSPKVDSSLVRLNVLDKPLVEADDEKLFFKIVRGAFNQRRKSILNSLSRERVLNISKEALSKILARIPIDPSIRPESLTLSDFASIANAVSG